MNQTIKCPHCRSQHELVAYVQAREDGTLQHLCYNALQSRIDDSILTMKELASEAFKARDMDTVEEMQQLINGLEQQKLKMRKPNQ